jgi:hypothetical protein
MTIVAGLLVASGASALTVDESGLGDFPGSSVYGNSPPTLLLQPGLNQVGGSIEIIENFPTSYSVDRDAFRIQLPAGRILSSVSIAYSVAIGGNGINLFVDHTMFLAPPAADPSLLTSIGYLNNGASGTQALFAGQLPATAGGLHEIYLDGFSSSIDGTGTFLYDYTIDLVVVPEPATGVLVGLGLLVLTAARTRTAR